MSSQTPHIARLIRALLRHTMTDHNGVIWFDDDLTFSRFLIYTVNRLDRFAIKAQTRAISM